ncbi:MAG: radical SAM protein [Defluviitaleaceae bacterium]|nr:radical SAM protein [Defluviitaleaceae bacterium]
MIHKITKTFVQYSAVVVAFLKLRRVFSAVDDFLRKLLGKKPVLYLLEYHVADHCNLNCKGCFHFSNLVTAQDFPSLAQYRRDLARLAELYANIRTIRLMGGEPLLNAELAGFITATKAAFPRAKICLLTNGLLYKRLSGELLSTVKTNNVEVQVSLYKPVVPQKPAMQTYFRQNEIKHSISPPITKFAQYINIVGDSAPHESVKQCPASRCTFLGGGFIARCPLPFNIQYLGQKTEIQAVMQNEKIDIYDKNLDGFILKKMLSKPMKACRYCGKLEWFEWQQDGCDVVDCSSAVDKMGKIPVGGLAASQSR